MMLNRKTDFETNINKEYICLKNNIHRKYIFYIKESPAMFKTFPV